MACCDCWANSNQPIPLPYENFGRPQGNGRPAIPRHRPGLHRQKSRPVGRRQSVDPPAVILPSLQRSHAVSGGQPCRHQSPPLGGWKARDFGTGFCGLGDRAKITSHFPAGSFARRLRCSLLTDPLAGYARRSRLASGQNSRAVKHEFIFARSLGHHLSLPPARADAARPPNPWARNPPLRVSPVVAVPVRDGVALFPCPVSAESRI